MPIREGEKVSDEHLSIHDDLRKSPQKYDFYDESSAVFSPNNRSGVSHTPWNERKWNQPISQYSLDFNRTSVGAYRIRPEMSGNETNTYPINHRFQPNKCRGVSHTPWNERKWNQHISQYSLDFNRTSVGAYRIRPDVGGNETNTYPNIASISTEQV